MTNASMQRRAALACATAVLSLGSVTLGETIYGVTDATAPVLFRFDSATPNATTNVAAITGIVAGQALRGIDFRPANGQLYGISSSGAAAQLYTINLATAVATPVGPGVTLTGNTSIRVSMDFNPVADRVRVVTSGGTNNNYRINPNDGLLVAQDGNAAYAAGDINFGSTPSLAGAAYTNNVPGATSTSLYVYDFINDDISTMGSPGGVPVSPNTGQLFTVGDSGFVTSDAAIGFDISGITATAYLQFDTGATATDNLYTVNLATGAATVVGQIGPVGQATPILDISAVVPEPASLALAALGSLALLRRR